jgi:hypothetical protein
MLHSMPLQLPKVAKQRRSGDARSSTLRLINLVGPCETECLDLSNETVISKLGKSVLNPMLFGKIHSGGFSMKSSKFETIHSDMFESLRLEQQGRVVGGQTTTPFTRITTHIGVIVDIHIDTLPDPA